MLDTITAMPVLSRVGSGDNYTSSKKSLTSNRARKMNSTMHDFNDRSKIYLKHEADMRQFMMLYNNLAFSPTNKSPLPLPSANSHRYTK